MQAPWATRTIQRCRTRCLLLRKTMDHKLIRCRSLRGPDLCLRSRRLLSSRLLHPVLQAVGQGPTLHRLLPSDLYFLLDPGDGTTQGAAVYVHFVHSGPGSCVGGCTGPVASKPCHQYHWEGAMCAHSMLENHAQDASVEIQEANAHIRRFTANSIRMISRPMCQVRSLRWRCAIGITSA